MRNDRRVRRPGGIAIFTARKMAIEVSEHSVQGWRRGFGSHAIRLRNGIRLQADMRPARAALFRPTALAVRDRDGATADFRLSGVSAKEIEPVLKPLLAADAPALSGH